MGDQGVGPPGDPGRGGAPGEQGRGGASGDPGGRAGPPELPAS